MRTAKTRCSENSTCRRGCGETETRTPCGQQLLLLCTFTSSLHYEMCLCLVAIWTGKFWHQLVCSGHVPFLLCKMSVVHFLVRLSYHLSLLDLQDFCLLFLINTGWILFISYSVYLLLILRCVFKKKKGCSHQLVHAQNTSGRMHKNVVPGTASEEGK